MKLTFQSGAAFGPALLSASNAYTLSCIVATNATLCAPCPGIVTFGMMSGWPSTQPSTVYENILPNELELTFAGVRVVSFVFWPVRPLSARPVNMPTKPEGGGLLARVVKLATGEAQVTPPAFAASAVK